MTRPFDVVETEWCEAGAHWTVSVDQQGTCPGCAAADRDLAWALRRMVHDVTKGKK